MADGRTRSMHLGIKCKININNSVETGKGWYKWFEDIWDPLQSQSIIGTNYTPHHIKDKSLSGQN
jgi:hypothetical protein